MKKESDLTDDLYKGALTVCYPFLLNTNTIGMIYCSLYLCVYVLATTYPDVLSRREKEEQLR